VGAADFFSDNEDHLYPRPPDLRRCVPIRLTEIPKDTRLEAARRASRYEVTKEQRMELFWAALFPSDRVYWVSDLQPLRRAA